MTPHLRKPSRRISALFAPSLLLADLASILRDRASGSGRQRRALLVGIRDTRDSDYGPIPSAHDDVRQMYSLLVDVCHYEPKDIVCLVDDGVSPDPTKENLLRAIDKLVQGVKSGDHIFFHYSGHTTQQLNRSLTEDDGMDEVLIAGDGAQIVDNTLYDRLVAPLPSGSHLVAVLDTCHSGTLLGAHLLDQHDDKHDHPTDLRHYLCNRPGYDKPRHSLFYPTIREVLCVASTAALVPVTLSSSFRFHPWSCLGDCRRRPGPEVARPGKQPVRADVICLSSCQDSQSAWDVSGHATFTACLAHFLRTAPDSTLHDVVKQMTAQVEAMTFKREARGIENRRFVQWALKHARKIEKTSPVLLRSLSDPHTVPSVVLPLQPERPPHGHGTFILEDLGMRDPAPRTSTARSDPHWQRRPRRPLSQVVERALNLGFLKWGPHHRRQFFLARQDPELSSGKPIDMGRTWMDAVSGQAVCR
ncbi:unnamed protein product [Mycena citricolor]|uniref:Peptidase C14 caspase domain-containing protein n=1 Tax=Mycena citricolor TaxID=2018698 RepID=A0AAD2GXV4_9AGAR|nr:unnamed protein product [Mycena citricolor]